MNEKKAPIAVLAAMREESEYLASRLENTVEEMLGGYEVTKGELAGVPVVLVRCHVGMVNAAAATALLIERYAPRFVLNEGSAGGHDPALHRYDIVLGEEMTEIMHWHTPVCPPGGGSHPESWEAPGADLTGSDMKDWVRILKGDPNLLKLARQVPYEKGRLVCGRLGSGDVWNNEWDRIAYLNQIHGTACEDMESFAAAQICAGFGVPFLSVRIISNTLLHESETDFALDSAVFCQQYTERLIRAIAKSL